MIRAVAFSTKGGRSQAELRKLLDLQLNEFCSAWHETDLQLAHYVAPSELPGWTTLYAGYTDTGDKYGVVVAGASSPNIDEAVAVLIGELNERMAIARFDPPVLAKGTAEQLETHGYKLFDWKSYLGIPLDGFRSSPEFTETTECTWIAGESLTNGTEVLVPRGLVVRDVDQNWGEVTTVGCASAATAKVASERAQAEVLERDLLRLSWFLGASPSTMSGPVESSYVLDGDSWDTSFHRVSSSHSQIGVVLVYSRCRDAPIFSVGSAYGPLDQRQTVDHAYRECMQGRLHSAIRSRNGELAASQVRRFRDHGAWYSCETRIGVVDAYFRGAGIEVEYGVPNQQNGVLIQLRTDSYTSVVRVLLPEAQRLEAAHQQLRVSKRLGELAKNRELVLLPHPFA